MLEPVSTSAGVVAVLKMAGIFAALWAPVFAKILAMASSRTREGHADESGGEITQDHESLALGLGLLTAWKPGGGFALNRPMLPRWTSQAHIMTVNPFEQLYSAGVLGEGGGKGRPATRADDWIFELFITHPNTTQRIERLYEMARARVAGLK